MSMKFNDACLVIDPFINYLKEHKLHVNYKTSKELIHDYVRKKDRKIYIYDVNENKVGYAYYTNNNLDVKLDAYNVNIHFFVKNDKVYHQLITSKKISDDEIKNNIVLNKIKLFLRKFGFNVKDDDLINLFDKSLENSVCIYDNNKIIGICSLNNDGFTIYFSKGKYIMFSKIMDNDGDVVFDCIIYNNDNNEIVTKNYNVSDDGVFHVINSKLKK